MDFEHKGIFLSVKNITGEVLKLSIYKVDGGERLLLHELNKQMIEELKIVGRPEIKKLRYIASFRQRYNYRRELYV